VKIQEVKKLICIVFMFGFFAGIVYLNVFARSYLVSLEIFDGYFLEQYSGNNLNTNTYIWYIAKLRLFPVICLWVISKTGYARVAGALFLLWTGFASGMILSASVFKLGMKGIILCIVGVIPHFICYITAFIMLILYLFNYPDTRWNSTKTVCMVLFLLLGIITEAYINPVLLDIFIKLL